MEWPKVPVKSIGNGYYRVCTPGGGMCIEIHGFQGAKHVAEAIYCSSHSDIRASRASVQ